jgi:hypothetical protein
MAMPYPLISGLSKSCGMVLMLIFNPKPLTRFAWNALSAALQGERYAS